MSFSEKILPWLSIRFFPVLLAVSVYGFTISLLFWRGTYELSLYVAAFAVMGLVVVRWLAGHQDLADPSDGPAPQALATEGKGTGDSPLPCGEERVRERGLPTPRLFPDRSFLIFFAIVLMLVVQGMMTAGSRITGDFHGFLLWSVLMVYAVGLLPERLGGRFRISHRWLGAVVVAASVPVQIVAYFHSVDNAEAALMVELSRIVEITHANVYADVDGFLALVEIAKAAAIANAAALFPNIHLLALYSVLTLPILFYFSLQPGNAMRWLFLLALLGDFWLLMKTQSRPGFLALLAGSLAVVPLLSFRLALAALAAAILVPTGLYVTGAFGFGARVTELIEHFAREERLAMWRETLALLQANSVSEWIFGHGFGQFLLDYKAYSSFHGQQDFSFPHNFVLELLYSHGVLGLVLVVGGYIGLFRLLVKALRGGIEGTYRQLGLLLICVLTVHGVHTFLTLPIFSRPALFPLSLILGAAFRFLRGLGSDLDGRHDSQPV